ncbi:MAG: diguanylate cyclase [Anaerotignum sp.]|nr:diguanylate cyclase [Anaerotignum sp.]
MRKAIISIFSIAMALSIFICGISIVFDVRDVRFNQEKVAFLTDGWFYQLEDGENAELTVPIKIPYAIGKPYDIFHTFYGTIPAGTFFGFRSSHQEVFVSLDGKEIYSFEKGADIPTFPHSPGSTWNIVELPEIHPGQVLKITAISYCKNSNERITEMMLGSKSAILFHIAKQYLPAAFMSILVIMFSMGLIFYGIYLYKDRHSSNFIYLGLFAFLMGVWLFGESRFIQFFLGKVLFTYQIVFLSIALMPIPGSIFFSKAVQPKNQRLFDLLCLAAGTNCFVMILAQTLGFADFYEWMPISHGIIILSIILFLYTIVECIHSEAYKKSKFLFLGFSVFLFFGILNIIYFYLSDEYDSAILLRLGTLIAFMIIAKGEINKNLELIRIGLEAEAFKKAAYTDAMTQLGNRHAFDMALEEMQKKAIKGNKDYKDNKDNKDNAICIIDIDGLKFTNDTFGHWMGDKLICCMAECLKSVFPENESCFRIGGDEFAVVMRGERAEMQSYLNKLKDQIIWSNGSRQSVLNASWGLAFQADTQENSIYQAFQMADAYMYQNKERKKNVKHIDRFEGDLSQAGSGKQELTH